MKFRIFLFAILLLITNLAASQTLEITGKIKNFTDATRKSYVLSEPQFLALPQTTIRTATTWTPVADFSGVKMAELMKLSGAYGTIAEVYALDDFIVQIPIEEFEKYGVILARKMDGALLKLSNFGPYFVIYPRDLHLEKMKTIVAESKFAWNVYKIVIR